MFDIYYANECKYVKRDGQINHRETYPRDLELESSFEALILLTT